MVILHDLLMLLWKMPFKLKSFKKPSYAGSN